MRLSLEHLEHRHYYWRYRIAGAGIWDSEKFQPAAIVIRKASRRYNAMFHRRIRTKNLIREIIDKIIIYEKVEEFDAKFLDSILVHEMIHQYIIQNDLKDTSTHGRLFRYYMKLINTAFEGELDINITDRNPSLPTKGPGNTIHKLIIAIFENNYSYCAVIHPARIKEFERMMKANRFRPKLKDYAWGVSDDVYFNQFQRCMKTFHGVRKTVPEMKEFCSRFNVVLTKPLF